uniref:Fibronectin type-III domain-containing protein n=1 Tax=Timema bartmani TaxID=61472 RepID=A0A7R9EVA0_9NEOP|nr:unnamed protein product [Timema bartmani]
MWWPLLAAALLCTVVDAKYSKVRLRGSEEEGYVCGNVDIRNSVETLEILRGCRVVEGFVHIVLIESRNETLFENVSFPELVEITCYLLVYRVFGLRSIGSLFPNLAVIRGYTLVMNYALIVFQNDRLQELGLWSLKSVLRGSVRIERNDALCFLDTVDWDVIVPHGENYFSDNKELCPGRESCGRNCTHCWGVEHPERCRADNKLKDKKCNELCIGDCSGPGPQQCLVCKKLLLGDVCVDSCPSHMFEYLGRLCVNETECTQMQPWPLTTDGTLAGPWGPFNGACVQTCPSLKADSKHDRPWWLFNGVCVQVCPTGYEERHSDDGKKICAPCVGRCPTRCQGEKITSIQMAQYYRGCTYVQGALSIQVTGRHIMEELERSLGSIEEVENYIKIARSFPLISLSFLKNLRVVHGRELDQSKYAFVVYENQNLVELWNWTTKPRDFQIKNGSLFFHNNHKLCLSHIEELRTIAKLPKFTNLEVAQESNGDKEACDIFTIKARVKIQRSTIVVIEWEPCVVCNIHTLLGYIVYYIEAPQQNITLYNGREACKNTGWRVIYMEMMEVSMKTKDNIEKLLQPLKPNTQYGFYVETYSVTNSSSVNKGGRSKIQNEIPKIFQTANLKNKSKSCCEKELERMEITDKVEYEYMCEKHNKFHLTRFATWGDDGEIDACKNYIYTYLHSELPENTSVANFTRQIFPSQVTQPTPGYALPPENQTVMVDGVYESFTLHVEANTTTVVIQNLHHFAEYNIKLVACREQYFDKEESITDTNYCSFASYVNVRTLHEPRFDRINSKHLAVDSHNGSKSDVYLSWKEPRNPNGIIVAYQIEHRRTDIKNYKPTRECITRKQHELSSGYVLKRLAPGKYGFRIQATSLAGDGEFTEMIYYVIEAKSSGFSNDKIKVDKGSESDPMEYLTSTGCPTVTFYHSNQENGFAAVCTLNGECREEMNLLEDEAPGFQNPIESHYVPHQLSAECDQNSDLSHLIGDLAVRKNNMSFQKWRNTQSRRACNTRGPNGIRCSENKAEDKSGNNLENLIQSKKLIPNGEVAVRYCVPDVKDEIKNYLKVWTDMDVDVILTTGGTGFSPRDITPEATREVIHREAPGLTIAMIRKSLEITPHAMLSRLPVPVMNGVKVSLVGAVCGIRGNTLIVNLPGSTKASQECLESIAMSIPHAVSVMRNRILDVEETHQKMHGDSATQHSHNHHHHHHNHHNAHKVDQESKVDVSKVARRARTSTYPLLDVDTAQRIVLEHAELIGTETVKFKDALGRVLAENVLAKDPLPPFPASIKDGYAVIASDGAGPRTVLGDSTAGPSEPAPLKQGQCVRINTGAPLPAGADCVVQVEDTKLLKEGDDGQTELEVEILVPPTAGQEIRPVGSDIALGQLVLASGAHLGPSELGLLATVGVVHVQVYKLPVVTVLSTGNELQDPGKPLETGCIRDSNKTTLVSLMKEAGFPVVDAGIARDNPKAVLSKLKEALSTGDVIVTTGSVSMGERDILRDVLITDIGATVHYARVYMKPGKPTTFATCDYEGKKKLILGLPGNPVSATVTSHLYVLPALRKMAGHPSPLATIIKATTEEEVALDPRPEYHRAILSWSEGITVPTAKSTGNQISSRLLSCSAANCLLILPPRTDSRKTLAKGELVDAMIISRI